MREKKILFICNVYPEEYEDKYFSGKTAGFQAAAVAWQWNIINGIEEILGNSISLLSGILIPQCSSKYLKIFFRSRYWSHKPNSTDFCISFLNIFPIKNIFREINIQRSVKRWLKDNSDFEEYVIAYSPHVPFIKALKNAKKYGAATCVIIPDLPEFAGASRMNETLYRVLKRHDVKAFYKAAVNINYYVFLTDKMKNRFALGINYAVIEGMCDPHLANYDLDIETIQKTVLYSGSIMREYGILQLLEAFQYIRSANIRLMICGDGDAKENVEKASRHDGRISYLGCLPRDEVIKLQRKATVLINPRGEEGEFTEYSFPSKILEYMLAAKPVICCKLGGIPDEYDNYLIYISNNAPQSIANKIQEVCAMDYEGRKLIGERARDFVILKKNYLYQSKLILELLHIETMN